MKNNNQILRCPFCNREPNIEIKKNHPFDSYSCDISCNCDGLSPRARQFACGFTKLEAKEKAYKLWNTRYNSKIHNKNEFQKLIDELCYELKITFTHKMINKIKYIINILHKHNNSEVKT